MPKNINILKRSELQLIGFEQRNQSIARSLTRTNPHRYY